VGVVVRVLGRGNGRLLGVSLAAALAFGVVPGATVAAAAPRASATTAHDVDETVEPDALALKQQAIALVEGMRYPNPDLTAPGKDFRKEEILLALRAATEGLYSQDGFLEGSEPFDQDVRAAHRLEQLIADPKVEAEVKQAAGQALDLVVQADRLLVADLIDATGMFPQPFPKAAALDVQRAGQELGKGDDQVAKGHRSAALADYVKAYRYAEAAGVVLFATFDPDGDDLPDEQEQRLGTDGDSPDSDGDGLTDGYEALRTGTDPLVVDTRATGTADADKDVDSDGLTHLAEAAAGTDPLNPDSDGDGLTDGSEIAGGTDPRKQDSDTDGLTDDSELRLGTDPRNPDSDGDALLDGFETYTSTAGSDDGAVSVALTGVGDVAGSASFDSLREDERFQSLPGQVSDAFDITVPGAFTDARISFAFDPAAVPNGDLAGLRVMYYDELAQTFLELDTQGLDAATGTAWAQTSHFSTYVLFYLPAWNAVWTTTDGSSPRGPDSGEFKNIDVMLTLDSSGSMSWYDPRGLRRTAAKQFVDALVEGDRAGVIDFDGGARKLAGLTTDFPAVKAAIDRIDSWGGTNIAAGVSLGNAELIDAGDPDHLKVQILLTDGEGYYDPRLTQQAKDAGITIYTIGLGPGVDAGLLGRIATGTGGTFFPVSSADGLPQIFRRIADGGGSLTDSDGDGLPDSQETSGIRLCTGELLKTNPQLRDTDGDGLSDLEELGQRQSVPAGSCYAPTSNPATGDTDRDGLLDVEEREIGTSPYRADSDSDSLSDAREINETGSDPLNRNSDKDGRDDAEEADKDSDPYFRDLEGWDHAKAAVAGFIWGDSGERAVRWHLIDRSTLESLSYLGGWLVSGYAVIGDVRDIGSSLWDGRFGTAVLSGVALVPLVGDAVKTLGVVRKFVSFSNSLRLPVTKWISRQFADHNTTRRLLYQAVGANSGLDSLGNVTLDALAKTRNNLGTIGRILPDGRTFLRTASMSSAGKAAVASRISTHWPGVLSAAQKAEAVAVESAVEVLAARGYRMLYVGRPGPVPGTTTHVSKGPDIVAVTPAGRTVVVEAKGAVGDLSINNSRLTSKIGGLRFLQPNRNWLITDARSRYLDVFLRSTDSDIQQATARLQRIIDRTDGYDAVIVAAAPRTSLGKVDDTLSQLHGDRGLTAEIITMNTP
jgi:hypothetical protein